MIDVNAADAPERKTWIAPEIVELNVSETEVFPNRGADGGRFVDCTRS